MVEVFHPAAAEGIFTHAKPIAVFMIRIAAIYVLVEAMLVIFIGALRGAGDTFWAMLISVSLHWLIVPVLYVMMKIMGLSLETCWSAVITIFFVFSFVVYLRYRTGHWRKIKVIQLPIPSAAAVIYDDFHEPSDL